MMIQTAVVEGTKVVVTADTEANQITITKWEDLLVKLTELRDDLQSDEHAEAATLLTTVHTLLKGAA